MAAAMRRDDAAEPQYIEFAFGAIGLVGRPEQQGETAYVWIAPDGSLIAFAGLPLVEEGGRYRPISGECRLVRDALAGDPGGDVLGRLGKLDGAHVAVWWCASRREFTVATDFLGMQPLYSMKQTGCELLASEPRAIAQSGIAAVSADPGAWAAVLYFGNQVGGSTQMSGVMRVDPHTTVVYSSPARARANSNWEWPEPTPGCDADDVRDALSADMLSGAAAYGDACPDASLLLSGGYDSRYVAYLCHELGLTPQVMIQEHPDENADADARFARAVAGDLGWPYRLLPARRDFFSTPGYLKFLMSSGVSTPSHRLFIANVGAGVQGVRGGIWEGGIIGPLTKWKYPPVTLNQFVRGNARPRRERYARAARMVFSARWLEVMDQGYEELLSREVARLEGHANSIWRFNTMNRIRFRTGNNPFQVYDAVTPVLVPGMTHRAWELVSRSQPDSRRGHGFQEDLLDLLHPRAMDTPVATGAELVPGRGHRMLHRTQRIRGRVQRALARPKVQAALTSLGLQGAFRWEPSSFCSQALGEAALDDSRLNADAIRELRESGAGGEVEGAAAEILMYWQAWHHVMRGESLERWVAESPGAMRHSAERR